MKISNNLYRVTLSTLLSLLIVSFIAYVFFSNKNIEPVQILQIPPAPQAPVSPQSIQTISSFRTLPCIVNSVIRYTQDYMTISVSPNSSAQPNTEYGIQVNSIDTGLLRTQINVAWNQQDIQSKKQYLNTVVLTSDEKNNYPLQAAYWDGVNISVRSIDFSFKYSYKLLSINGKTEQQLVAQQNQEQQDQYAQQKLQYDIQYAQYKLQEQAINNQQVALNNQYLQRLSGKEFRTNISFIIILVIIFVLVLFVVYSYLTKSSNPPPIKPERSNSTVVAILTTIIGIGVPPIFNQLGHAFLMPISYIFAIGGIICLVLVIKK